MNGEMDAFGAASEIREAYPQAQVIAIAGSDHFFTGKRDELGRIVTDHLALALASR
jgi:alpha/beta superfamily hydrolase